MLAADEALVIDVRAAGDWIQGHIPGVQSMPYYHLEGMAGNLPKGKPIVTVCNQPICPQGPEVARTLIDKGVDDVAYLRGGIEAWVAEGRPLQQ